MANLETIIDSPRLAAHGQLSWRGAVADALHDAEDTARDALVRRLIADGRLTEPDAGDDWPILDELVGLLELEDLRELLDDPNASFVNVDNSSLPALLLAPFEIVTRALRSKGYLTHRFDLDPFIDRCFKLSFVLKREVCVVSTDEFWAIAKEYQQAMPELDGEDLLIARAIESQIQVVEAEDQLDQVRLVRQQALVNASRGGVYTRRLGKEIGITHQAVSKILKPFAEEAEKKS